MCHIMCHIIYMPSVNIRQLRDTRRLKAWLRAGKTVELRERDHVIAQLCGLELRGLAICDRSALYRVPPAHNASTTSLVHAAAQCRMDACPRPACLPRETVSGGGAADACTIGR